MGCWNGTCMISNLPIIYGDRIKVILLHNRYASTVVNRSNFVYPTGLLMPAFFPISGEYNDYGSIENIDEDWSYKVLSKYLEDRFSNLKADGVETEVCVETLINGIERGGIEVFGVPQYMDKVMLSNNLEIAEKQLDIYSEKDIENMKKTLASIKEDVWFEPNISMVMVREDVWDGIMKEHIGERWSGDSVIAYYRRRFDKHVKAYQEADNDRTKMFVEYQLSEIFNDSSDNVGHLFDQSMYANALKDILDGNDDTSLDSVFKHSSEYRLIGDFLSVTRRSWMIQSGAGSQDESWVEHVMLAKLVIAIAEEEKDRWEDEDEDDDE